MADENYPYRLRQDFLSSAEAAFYRVLREMVNDHFYICPKVALQDLFFVTRPNENVHYFNKIYRKNVDFLLLRRDTLKPALGIELEYKKQAEHRPAELFIEQVFAQAGLPLVRVVVQKTYDVAALAAQFSEALRNVRQVNPLTEPTDYSPICPRCGITMVLRIYRDGPNAGQKYYGCLNYPTCQETLALPA